MTKDKGFLKFGFIKNMLSPTVAQIEDIGGEVQETIISPKGLYSKPVETDAVNMPVMDGETQMAVMPIQDFIDWIKDRDVILTDDKSYIHFQYEDGKLKISADAELDIYANKKITVTSLEEIEMIAPKVKVTSGEFTWNSNQVMVV